MIQGLYFSATGVLANSYRQDVIANNIANSETVGFRKDLALFQQRPTEAQSRGTPNATNRMLEGLGGGLFASPTLIDTTQGDLEPSSNTLDVAIEGTGYFKVDDAGKPRLTRDGRFTANKTGQLAMMSGTGQPVIDIQGRPIQLDPTLPASQTTIDKQGFIIQGDGTPNRKVVGQIGLFDIADPSQLKKAGGNLMSFPETADLRPGAGQIMGGMVEHANVDPAIELSALMDAQRQLEANANMIRYQDATLARLVNDVGKIS